MKNLTIAILLALGLTACAEDEDCEPCDPFSCPTRCSLELGAIDGFCRYWTDESWGMYGTDLAPWSCDRGDVCLCIVIDRD